MNSGGNTRIFSRGFMESNRYEIRIGGTGGQGIITTGIIMGEAATVYDHKYAVQTQSYGPEARGGSSKTDVIISSEPIDYPKVIQPDCIAVLSREAFRSYGMNADPAVLLIADEGCVEADVSYGPNFRIFPICQRTIDVLGGVMATNVTLFGIIIGLTGIISLPAAEIAVATRFASRKPEYNLKALRLGYEMAYKPAPEAEDDGRREDLFSKDIRWKTPIRLTL